MKALSSGKYKRGVSTLEILIAFAVLAMTMSAVIVVAFGNQTLSADAQTNIEAVSKAQEQLEVARALARADFGSVVGIATTTDDIYKKGLSVTTSSDGLTKTVTSLVDWTAGGRTLSVSFKTLLTNSGGETCSQTLSGDWTSPQVYGYVDFASSAGATGVNAAGAKTYITSNPSSSGADDFYVIDTSAVAPGGGTLPILGRFSTGLGLTDIRVLGSYAYVAADSATAQLLAINIADPTALGPSKITAQKDVTALSDTAVGNTLYRSGKRLYLGLTKSSGPEFYIFDLTDPANPTKLGSGYEVNAAVNGIVVKNNIAYLATADTKEVIALDVSNPSAISVLGTYTSPTLTGQSLVRDSGTTLYFGRIGGAGNPKLLALNTANLSVPKWTMNMSSQSGVYTLILRGNLLFMTTADPNDGLQIWDVSGASPARYDTSPLNIQQTSTAGTDCFGNLLFVAQRSQRALQVVGPYVSFGYTLATEGNKTAVQGASVTNTVTATLTGGIAQNVGFSLTGLPSGATANFSPNSCVPSPSCTSTLTVSAGASTPPGPYTIVVSGAGGITTSFVLQVTAAPIVFDYSFTSMADVQVNRGSSVTNTVTITKAAGSTAQAVTISSSNSTGVTVTPGSVSCTPNATCSVTFTYSASAGASLGNKTITITGATPSHTTTFKLKVN